MRYVYLSLICLLLTGCSVISGLKMPEAWKSLGKTPDKAIAAGTTTNAAMVQVADADKKLQDAKLKIEQEYEKFRQDLELTYKKREEIDIKNFDEISKVNYGIYYVTNNEKKDTDIDFLIAHLRAKENMARLDQLPEEVRMQIRSEVDTDKRKTMEALLKKYEEKVKEGLLVATAYEEATKLIQLKEDEKRKLREENKITLQRLEAEKSAEIERIRKETEAKIASAKEEQRMEMLRWIIKALSIVGILQLVGGLLLKSPTFIIAGIFTLGIAYVTVMIPFWVVALSMGVIILAMVIINPKTGKCDILKKSALPTALPKVRKRH